MFDLRKGLISFYDASLVSILSSEVSLEFSESTLVSFLSKIDHMKKKEGAGTLIF